MLLPVALLMLLFSAIAAGAAAVVRVEVRLAERFRQAAEARYAAEAGLDAVMSELRELSSWESIVGGAQVSRLSQGAFLGAKTVPGGGEVHVCCGPGSALDRLTAETRLAVSPWRRALTWRPFLWTTFDALVARTPASRLFLIVWIANDDEDEAGAGGDTNGIVLVRAEAIDPSGVRRLLEALIARMPDGPADEEALQSTGDALPSRLAVLAWREVR